MGKPVTYDHLKSSKKPVYKSVWIALDPELADEEADLKQKVSQLRIRHTARPTDEKIMKDLSDAEQMLEEATAALRENSVKFTFRSIGRRRYDDLLSDHQPTPEHIAEAKKMDPQGTLDFNPETFPQVLIAASIHEPKLSKDEVLEIFQSEDWSAAELSALFEAALVANTTRRIIDLGNASRGTNGSSSN